MSAMLPDLPPSPPEKPLAFDCCESGCDRCVFDIYAEELAFYEAELAAWRERNPGLRSEEHTSELQSLMRISYAVFCLKTKQVKLQSASYITSDDVTCHAN